MYFQRDDDSTAQESMQDIFDERPPWTPKDDTIKREGSPTPSPGVVPTPKAVSPTKRKATGALDVTFTVPKTLKVQQEETEETKDNKEGTQDTVVDKRKTFFVKKV